MAKSKKTSASEPSYLQQLASQLIDLAGGNEAYDKRAVKYIKGGEVPPEIVRGAFTESPFKTNVDFGKGVTGNSLRNTLSTAGSAIAAHPFASAGLGILGATNISGLVDDDKIGGQLVGGGLGLAAPALMTKLGMAAPTPIGKLAMVMGGGALGSLFDKLRAKKEAEQQVYQQEY